MDEVYRTYGLEISQRSRRPEPKPGERRIGTAHQGCALFRCHVGRPSLIVKTAASFAPMPLNRSLSAELGLAREDGRAIRE